MSDFVITINITENSTNKQVTELLNCLEAVGSSSVTCFCQADYSIEDTHGDGNHLLLSVPETKMEVEKGWLVRRCAPFMRAWHSNYSEVPKVTSVRVPPWTDMLLEAYQLGFSASSSVIGSKSGWEFTGNTPYKPFVDDYGVSGNPCLNIIEVPHTTMFINGRRQAISPFVRPELLQEAFDAICDKIPVITISIDSDYIGAKHWDDDERDHSINNLESNLKHMIKSCGDVKFKTVNQIRI